MVTNVGEALGFVKREGPIIPSQLANELNTNILFASAILSELTSKKEVIITCVKRGSSPFYYCKGQEEKLQGLSEYLSGKLKEAYELIKEKKVLRDSAIEPWQRVALREIKDYAIQLNVGLSTGYEIFWKWYMLSNDDVKSYIKKIVSGKKKVEKEVIPEFPEVKKEEVKENSLIDEKIENPVKEDKIENPIPFVGDFLKQNDVYVISQDIVRKGKEMNFIGDIPSNIGKLRYFIKFKSKKIIADNDLISALDEGNKKGLPVLFLSDGEMNKKAESYLNNNVSGKLIFKNFS